jgi:hypothetical protein
MQHSMAMGKIKHKSEPFRIKSVPNVVQNVMSKLVENFQTYLNAL